MMSENLSVLSSSRVPEILKGEYKLQKWKKIQVKEILISRRSQNKLLPLQASTCENISPKLFEET